MVGSSLVEHFGTLYVDTVEVDTIEEPGIRFEMQDPRLLGSPIFGGSLAVWAFFGAPRSRRSRATGCYAFLANAENSRLNRTKSID